MKVAGALIFLASVVLFVNADEPDYYSFFKYNILNSGLPLSYHVPDDYFPNIPESLKPKDNHVPQNVVVCDNRTIQPDELNEYEFQTEQFLTTIGLNIYDGAMWQIASMLEFQAAAAQTYQDTTLIKASTLQLLSIKADRPCVNVEVPNGPCFDKFQNGNCGLCYGSKHVTLPTANAYFFRMISDYYSLEGTVDARCPDLGHTWVWNDWRPVTGENSWASLIGPLQLAYKTADGDVDLIPDECTAFTLALNYLPALQAMQIPSLGAIYYAPYNTYDVRNSNVGATVSVENNVSTLGGLRMLYDIIARKANSAHKGLLPQIRALIEGIEKFLKSSYYAEGGYFRQGGSFNTADGSFTWVKEPFFAVDCQTWTLGALGAKTIDGWFGAGTTMHIWNTTKVLGGYKYNETTGRVRGLGYSNNKIDQVFSGEWTLGAANSLRILANELNDTALKEEGDELYANVVADLRVHSAFKNSVGFDAILYANKRYFIPFGWWANPLPAMASTAWADVLKREFNPFYLGGDYLPLGELPPASH